MLFKEIEDCDMCPFNEDGEYEDCCDHSGSTDKYHPCESMDKWGNMDVEDVAHKIYASRYAYEEHLEREWAEEDRLRKAKEEKAKKAREARMITSSENRQISRLRRQIRNNNKILNFTRSFASAVNMANEMFGCEERIIKKPKNLLEIENEKLQAKIDEIDKIRKEKLKQLRNKRKLNKVE